MSVKSEARGPASAAGSQRLIWVARSDLGASPHRLVASAVAHHHDDASTGLGWKREKLRRTAICALLIGIGCVAGASASAQRVEVLVFDRGGDAGGFSAKPRESAPTIGKAASGAGDRIAGERATPAVMPSRTSSVFIDRVLAALAAARPLARLLPTSIDSRTLCGASPYRARRDLAFSTERRRARFYPLVAQAACEAGVPVGLYDALIIQESGYQAGAISPKGAMGLAQLMPGTARALGVVDTTDPLANLRGGARYLRAQLAEFGRVDLALAAYNAGPGRVRRAWAIPPIVETRTYVARVARGWEMSTEPAPTVQAFEAAPLPPRAPAARPLGARVTIF